MTLRRGHFICEGCQDSGRTTLGDTCRDCGGKSPEQARRFQAGLPVAAFGPPRVTFTIDDAELQQEQRARQSVIDQLQWRGPVNGRAIANIVLPRELAAVLINRRDLA